MKKLRIDYTRITLDKRARLIIKALARGDTPFVSRLINSCHDDRTQLAGHLKGARECTLLVSLELQVILGRWEAFNALLLPIANSDHVDYFYEVFRFFPERVEKVHIIVDTLEDLLIEKTMCADGSDNSDLLDRMDEYIDMMTGFLCHEDIELDGGYTSSGSNILDDFRDWENCLLLCYILVRARERVVASIGPLWLAFCSACQSELEMDAEIVLKAFVPQGAISLIEDFRFELDSLDEELDIDRETESALRDFWRSSTS